MHAFLCIDVVETTAVYKGKHVFTVYYTDWSLWTSCIERFVIYLIFGHHHLNIENVPLSLGVIVLPGIFIYRHLHDILFWHDHLKISIYKYIY